MEVRSSSSEIKMFISDYRKQIEDFALKVGVPRTMLFQFISEKNREIVRKMATIDNELKQSGEYTSYEEITEEEKKIFEAIVGKKEINYDDMDFSLEGINSKEEAEKEHNRLYLEREMALNIVENKKEQERPEKLSENVAKIFEEQDTKLNELSKIDPDTAMKRFISRKYPEIAEILGNSIDLPDLYKRIDRLPNNLNEELKDIFDDEYSGFIQEIKERGEQEQQKLDDKIKEYNQSLNKDIYEKYKGLSDEEKEEFLKYSDSEMSYIVIKNLNHDVECAKENIKFTPIYSSYFDYCEKRELYAQEENETIAKKIDEVIDDKMGVELDKMSQIRGNIMPYFGKKKDLQDTTLTMMHCRELGEMLNPYLKSENAKQSLNNISEKKIEEIREKATEAGIDIKKVFSDASVSAETPCKEDLDVCGDMILEMANYETDDAFTVFLGNAYDDQMREELVSIAKYRIDDQRTVDKNVIRYISQSESEYSQEELTEIMEFCNLKYNSMEWHLKDVSSLINIKVKEPDTIGLRKLINNMDKSARKEIAKNSNTIKNNEEKIKGLWKQFDRLEPKKQMILEMRENALKEKDAPNERLVYGG